MLVEVAPDEAERFALAARQYHFDAFLAPYDLQKWSRWRALSDYVGPKALDMLAPVRAASHCSYFP